MAANLIYSAICSLDGYINDRSGNFDWAAPDLEVHRFVNDRERPIGTYLYGRRMYEVMTAWETVMPESGVSDAEQDYAEIWRSADKIVFSTTLAAVETARTTLRRSFDPDLIRAGLAAATADWSVGGATLAGEAFRAGLVDEIHLYLNPVIVGGGTRALPNDIYFNLTLIEEECFDNGVVFVRYQVR